MPLDNDIPLFICASCIEKMCEIEKNNLKKHIDEEIVNLRRFIKAWKYTGCTKIFLRD